MKRLAAAVLCLIVLAAFGCTGVRKQEVKSPAKNGKGEVNSVKLQIQSTDIYQAPDVISTAAERDKSREAATLLEDRGRFWVLITRGVKPTGGYSVKVSEAQWETLPDRKTKLTVYYRYKDPGPGQIVTQVLTTPRELVELKGLDQKPDEVKFIKQ